MPFRSFLCAPGHGGVSGDGARTSADVRASAAEMAEELAKSRGCVGAEHGVGSYILEAGALYDLERLFAGVTILSLLGLVTNWALGLIERHFLSWRG